MPLVAINQDNGKRIDLTDYAMPKIELQGNRFACPVCESRMTIRHGFKVAPHFAHLPSERCPYAEYAAGETPEHKSGKDANGRQYKKWVVVSGKDAAKIADHKHFKLFNDSAKTIVKRRCEVANG